MTRGINVNWCFAGTTQPQPQPFICKWAAMRISGENTNHNYGNYKFCIVDSIFFCNFVRFDVAGSWHFADMKNRWKCAACVRESVSFFFSPFLGNWILIFYTSQKMSAIVCYKFLKCVRTAGFIHCSSLRFLCCCFAVFSEFNSTWCDRFVADFYVIATQN